MNRSPGWPNLLGLVDPDPKDPSGLQTALGHPPGWAVFQRSLFSDATVYRDDDWTGLSDAGTAVICCLEWEPGSGGTVPGFEHLPAFASRCREYVQGTRGCHIWVVGDEPNRSSQWPGAAADPHPDAEGTLEVLPPRYLPGRFSQLTGHAPSATASDTQPITPEQYAECLKQAGAAIRSVPDHEDDLILCAAMAPWNADFRDPDNPSGDWINYFETVCAALGADDLQGFALHTATSGSDLGEITTEERLAFPFAGRRRGFRAYLDFIHAIPPRFHHLPVFITEVSRLEPWSNDDNGWTGAALADIQSHNRTRIQNPIRCTALYTWNSKSPWTLRGKPLLAADIARSIAALEVRRYQDSLLPVAWTRVEVPATMEPDRPLTVHLAFENAGTEPLAASGDAPVRISCMLGSTDPVSGNCIVEADRRFPLPSDLGPGQGCEVSIELEAPKGATDITLFIGIIPAGFLWSATVVEDAIQVPLRQEPEEEVEPEETTAADASDHGAGEPDAEPAAKPAAALENGENPTRDLEVEPPPPRAETAASPETDIVAEEPGISEPEGITDDDEETESEPVAECPEPEVRVPPAVIDLSAFFFRRLAENSAARVLTDVARIVFVESRFDGDPPINEITDHFAKQGYEQVPLHFLITEPNCIYQVHKAEHNPIPYAANLTSAVVLSLPKAQGDTHGWLSRFDELADTVFEVLATIFNGNPPPELEVGVDTLDGDLGFKSGASDHLEDICLLLSSRWTDGVDNPVPLTFVPVALPLEGSPPIAREPDPAEANPEMETGDPDADTMPDPTEPDTTETAVPDETAAADIEPVLTFDDNSGFVQLERDSARWLNLRFSHLQATSVCLWVSGENGTLPLAQFRRIHNMAASEVYCHYVVEPSGRILDTDRPAAAREHLPPKYRDAVHICLRGRVPHPQRNLDQLDACSSLLVELLHSPGIADRWQTIGGSLADVLLVGSSRWQHGPAWTDAMTATVSEVDVDQDPAAGSEHQPLDGQPHSAGPLTSAGAESGKPDRARTELSASSVTGQGGGGLDAPSIVDRVGTIPKHPVLDFPKRQLSAIRQIVVHHSGFPSHVTPHAMAESLVLDQLAMDGTEPGLPYHFFVQVDGTVEQIHDLSVACHSTQDGHDRIVAVCLAGTFSQGINPTPLQLEHAGHLIAWLLQTCYLSEADIVGHRDVDPFEEVCPGEEWSSGNNWSQTLRYHISRHLSGTPADAIPVS